MRRIHLVGGVLAAAALAGGAAALDVAVTGQTAPAATTGSNPTAGAPTAPTAPAATTTGIGVAALAPGTALVDGAGRTLYLFEADTGTMSTCFGACAQVWPPLLAPGDGQPGPGGVTGAAQQSLVGTAARPDGTRQVTYNGHPLYYFAGDTAPGDVKGQGIHNFGGGWYVLTAAGDKIDPDDPAPAAAPASGSRNGSGYGY